MIATPLTVIFFPVDVAFRLILTHVQNPFVVACQMTMMARTHPGLLCCNRTLLCFKTISFMVRELARALARVDQSLLVQLAHIDRGIRSRDVAKGNSDCGHDKDDGFHLGKS
jgi:hypothetical protein